MDTELPDFDPLPPDDLPFIPTTTRHRPGESTGQPMYSTLAIPSDYPPPPPPPASTLLEPFSAKESVKLGSVLMGTLSGLVVSLVIAVVVVVLHQKGIICNPIKLARRSHVSTSPPSSTNGNDAVPVNFDEGEEMAEYEFVHRLQTILSSVTHADSIADVEVYREVEELVLQSLNSFERSQIDEMSFEQRTQWLNSQRQRLIREYRDHVRREVQTLDVCGSPSHGIAVPTGGGTKNDILVVPRTKRCAIMSCARCSQSCARNGLPASNAMMIRAPPDVVVAAEEREGCTRDLLNPLAPNPEIVVFADHGAFQKVRSCSHFDGSPEDSYCMYRRMPADFIYGPGVSYIDSPPENERVDNIIPESQRTTLSSPETCSNDSASDKSSSCGVNQCDPKSG